MVILHKKICEKYIFLSIFENMAEAPLWTALRFMGPLPFGGPDCATTKNAAGARRHPAAHMLI